MSIDNDIVDRIYEAAFIPDFWSSVIERIASSSGAFGGSIYTSGAEYSAIAASENCKRHLDDMIALGWAQKNIRAQRLLASGYQNNSFSADNDYCTEDEIKNHPIYTEFLRPRGLGWTAGTFIAGNNDDFAIFSIDQLYEKGPFTSSALSYLNMLRPHIARSTALAMRIRQDHENATLSNLEALGIPALLARRDGSIQQINTLFSAIDNEILIGAGNKIFLKNTQAQALLMEALHRRDGDDAVQSIPVLTRDGSFPIILHVAPMRRQARDLFAKAEFIITVASVSNAKGDLSKLLSMLYDLTSAETRIVKHLCLGESLHVVAEKYNLSINTVRTQLKSVFSKTGTSRQSELISKFSNAGFQVDTSDRAS